MSLPNRFPTPIGGGASAVSNTTEESRAEARARQLLIEQVLLMVETGTQAGESLLQQEGKAAFRRMLEERPTMGPTGVAQRLFEAVTGYNFRAWRDLHDDGSSLPIDAYGRQVLDAINQGELEARRLLQDICEKRDDDEQALKSSIKLLHEKLERWFRNQHLTCHRGA
jgi:hypothetical protein